MAMHTLLSAQPLVALQNAKLASASARVLEKRGFAPKIAVVLVGDDPASILYTTRKTQAASKVGILHQTHRLPGGTPPTQTRDLIEKLNSDPEIDGILLQRPLPGGYREDELSYWIAPEKDVDAFPPLNIGRMTLGLEGFQPCTAAGILQLLDYYRIGIEGKTACVVGRSTIVGKPTAMLLLRRNATVIQCHSKTQSLASFTRQADLLIVAAGKPHFLDHTFVKPGAVIVDVGIHKNHSGGLSGDVDPANLSGLVSALTPVPGGVGPMTISVLLQNTVVSAELRAGIAPTQF